MATKPRYEPAKINITYTEGDTGDLVFLFSDVVDFTGKDVFMEVRDEDNNPIFSKDSGISDPTILIEDWLADSDDEESSGAVLGSMVTIYMLSTDTKHHESLTHQWELEIYEHEGESDEEINTLVNGKFVITKEIADHE